MRSVLDLDRMDADPATTEDWCIVRLHWMRCALFPRSFEVEGRCVVGVVLGSQWIPHASRPCARQVQCRTLVFVPCSTDVSCWMHHVSFLGSDPGSAPGSASGSIPGPTLDPPLAPPPGTTPRPSPGPIPGPVRGKSHERVPTGSDHFLCLTDLSQSVASFPCVRK